MKQEILVFLSNGYADWEGSYLCSELNKPTTGYVVKTVALSKNPVTSLGGFRVIPDYSIKELPSRFTMLLLIGGTAWLLGENDSIKETVDTCINQNIPIAAICDASTFLANNGYLDHISHTGNSLDYLEEFAPNYKGRNHFVEKQVVSTEHFITANGTSAVEFAKAILNRLSIMPKEKLESWYHNFKVGYFKE
ncbi:type 1 glutamine amidotransferase family protein [Clostridium sp. E02]|uniref:type 1 glutamine amidotransferase family protein n=1 Tax=Clostridium sp. E02 TaxID=2487134 RepID=UPI000F5231F3|nr:type 1 glutamine amidotransferase family protein [Clostridium sp. E02]